MITAPGVETANLVLRPLLAADASQAYADGLNDPEVNRFLEVRRVPQTLESVGAFIAAHEGARDAVLLGLFLKPEGRLIGTIRLHEIKNKSAYLGICLFARDCWGRGYGSEALDGAVRLAFDALGLDRLRAGSYEANAASLALFKKAGFEIVEREEGRLELDGAPARTVVMELARRDR